MKKISLVLFVLLTLSCKQKEAKKEVNLNMEKQTTYNFELQGHRGARGLAPENTIAAFKKALELGVNTLELDVVITKDKQVLVSHEPWLNYQITLDSLGQKLTKEQGLAFNMYAHTYAEIKKYDVGSLGNPNFPKQKKQKISKPLLTEVIALAENSNPNILYNIEIKSTVEDEAKGYQPGIEEFSDIFIALLKQKLPLNRVVIQSFDIRVLQYIHTKYPEYTLSYLVEEDNFSNNIQKLGFTPQIYSPYYVLLNSEEIKQIQAKNVKVIPWTVNNINEMIKLLEMGVNGIITDYPDIAIPLKK